MRSAGYFHITRYSIQRCLHERFIFLNDEDSQDYLSLMLMTNDKTPQKNTRFDIRKTPIDEKKVSKRIQILLENTKKDPYLWLDKTDPRRHMTDREILESTIDLSEDCITERQKQALYKILLKTEKCSHLILNT